MRKLLILMLVLGLASVANATLYYIGLEYRDSSGTTPISVVNLASPNFTLALMAEYSNHSDTTRLYDAYEALGLGSDVADMTGIVLGPAAGSSGLLSAYDSVYDGYDIDWGDTGYFNGDIAVISLTAFATGTLTVVSLDSTYNNVIDSASINIVPEPMTVALLGLGGLLLRRRK